jgi:hypothetical protein
MIECLAMYVMTGHYNCFHGNAVKGFFGLKGSRGWPQYHCLRPLAKTVVITHSFSFLYTYFVTALITRERLLVPFFQIKERLQTFESISVYNKKKNVVLDGSYHLRSFAYFWKVMELSALTETLTLALMFQRFYWLACTGKFSVQCYF